MKVIIAGGREITDYSAVQEAMLTAALFGIEPTEIVSGKARGVDTLGERWAAERGLPIADFPAVWRGLDGTYYPNAGKARNTDMAAYADALVAVWDGYSTGTADMIKKATRLGLQVWVQHYSYSHRAPPFTFARFAPDGYEVSSQGDKRFSALFARLKDGRTIEQAYQLDVKGYRAFSNDWRRGKGLPPLVKRDIWPEYLALWQQWASENPKGIQYLRDKASGKVLTDRFATSPISQARALAEVLNSSS